MGMNERLSLREVGYSRPTTGRHPKPLGGSGPLAFERSFNSSEDIIKRLTQTAEFTGDAACVSNVTWSPDGQFLAAGGEDCRITIWEPGTRRLKQTVDMGHTSHINSVRYLPSRNNEYIVSASNDKEVRLVNLVKKAVMPYKNHRGKVKSVAVIDPAIFVSAGEDGTVRQVDFRENGRAMTVIADQRQEKTGLVKARVPINSVAVCPLHPHLFATGGGDAIVRLYDRRMSSGQGSKPHKTPWFAGYMPMHFKSTLAHRPRPMPPLRPNVHISGVAFSHDGRKLFASYTNEQIYSFSCKQHQRAAAYFEAPDPSAHATRSTARLPRPTERRWPTAAWSQDTAEAGQAPARAAPAQQQQQRGGAPRQAATASAAPAGPEVDALATAVNTATERLIQTERAAQSQDEAWDIVRDLAEYSNAQAAPAPGEAGPIQTEAPNHAGLRRAASAPSPDVALGAEALPARIADVARATERYIQFCLAQRAAGRQLVPAAAAASNADGDADTPCQEEQQERRMRRRSMTAWHSRGGGSRSRLASRSGSVQAPLAQSTGRAAPGPANFSALEAPDASPAAPSPVVRSPVTRQAARRAMQSQPATCPADCPTPAVEGVNEAAVQSLNRPRHTQRDSRVQARREEAEAELAMVAPPTRRQRRAAEQLGSSSRQIGVTATQQAAQSNMEAANGAHAPYAHPIETRAADAPCPARPTASTLAAAGNAFALAGSSAERPTASTGTSRPVTRQQASLKKEKGTSDAPEQASGHFGQPRAFRAPLPRTCGARHAATAAPGAAEGGSAELPAGQAPEQLQSARQRRIRQHHRGSDCHSGAASTSRRALPLSGQPAQPLPGAAQRAQAAGREASSGLLAAQPASTAQAQPRALGDPPPEVNASGEGGDGNASSAATAVAVRRGRSRPVPAAVGASEPQQGKEDVCCERSQSAHAQEKRAKGAASPPSVQHAPAAQRSTEPTGNAESGAAAAQRSAAERPARTIVRADEAHRAAGQRASPQRATIQDEASQGPPWRHISIAQQLAQAAAATSLGVPAQTSPPEGGSEAGVPGGPARVPSLPANRAELRLQERRMWAASTQQRLLDTPPPARSSPNSSAAAIDTVHQGDDEADVVGPTEQQRHARLVAVGAAAARAGEGREQQQGADSYIGAIMDVSDADDGEVVEEDGMFDMVYSGHCNKQGCKEVSLIGEHSDFVCSGSDGGAIFVWNAKTGRLVNVLRANDTVTTCVAPHPHEPMLASCGFEPAVRLWSPEAAEATKLQHAEEIMLQNAMQLAQRTEPQIPAPQIFLNMGLAAPNAAPPMPTAAPAPELRVNPGDDGRDNAVRCTIM